MGTEASSVKVALTSAIILAAVSGVQAAEFDLKKGSLTRSGSYASQYVAVTNNTSVLVPAIRVECGFFRDDDFLVLGSGIATKIVAGQTAFVEVIANNGAPATKTECRVVTP
jgi:hypothetical protein